MTAVQQINPAVKADTRKMADAIRFLSMDAVEQANSGHPGMPMGMADVATVLFTRFMKFDPANPNWPDRDRFVLSAGHGSMLLYSLLYLTGYKDITLDELKRFRQLGAKTAGHPEYGHAAGIETTTGPLGQGIANAVGMALAERMMAARFGSLVDHYTYVIAGDGCLMEGISQEAISLAGHLKLSKLIVLWDDNRISIDGPTSLSTSEDMAGRFKAAGWNVDAIDGHDHAAIEAAIAKAQKSDKPVMIACRTTIAYGAPTKSGSEKSHGSPLGKDEISGTRKALGWQHEPFDVPADVLSAWRNTGAVGGNYYRSWQKVFNDSDEKTRNELSRLSNGELPKGWQDAVTKLKQSLFAAPVKEASRKSSENTLKILAPVLPELIGGSADLTGSNNTKTADMQPIKPGEYSGRYIYYGIREHGMAAVMNGLNLHGGFIPYGGTFLVFSDYCRPSIRLSALMNQGVVYVMTHDSIGLGEDGPTHQPVEHLAALRAIPNLLVIRPADAIETAEAWEIAIANRHRPTLLALSRQNLPQLRLTDSGENLSARGGYVLSPSAGDKPTITIIATGSETQLAVEAQKKLSAEGIAADVVSMPCWRLFDEQDAAYKKSVLPPHTSKIAVEAAIRMGWDKYIGHDGEFVGMEGFGASAPAEALYPHFKITVDEIVKRAKQ